MKIIIENAIKNTEALRILNLCVLLRDLEIEASYLDFIHAINDNCLYRNQSKIMYYSNQNNSEICFVEVESGNTIIKILLNEN